MGPIDIPATWHADFLARFANVPCNDHAPPPYVPFTDTHRPIWTWIHQSAYVILTLIFNISMHFKRM
jgi:hypothetical protein